MFGTTAAEWATATETALQEAAQENGSGTFDHREATEQMKAIDLAMRVYFDTDNWLEARDAALPFMRRRSDLHVT